MTSDSEMTKEAFWDLVAEVNWPSLCSKHRSPHEVGKQILLEKLPTVDDMESFRQVFHAVEAQLAHAIEKWEEENGATMGLGDDGFGDLCAHIVGCGQEEWQKNVADPSLAYDRAQDYKFTESFSYCIPFADDYRPPSEKLAEALRGLRYWQNKALTDPESSVPVREVQRRQEEIRKLEEQCGLVPGQNELPFAKAALTEHIETLHLELAQLRQSITTKEHQILDAERWLGDIETRLKTE